MGDGWSLAILTEYLHQSEHVLNGVQYESLNDFPEFLIPFIICDFKKEVNFSMEIVFEKSKANIQKPPHNISVDSRSSIVNILLIPI
jgi:hypothetical protein